MNTAEGSADDRALMHSDGPKSVATLEQRRTLRRVRTHTHEDRTMTEDRIVTLMNRIEREPKHCWFELSAGEKRVIVGMLNEHARMVEDPNDDANLAGTDPTWHVVSLGGDDFLVALPRMAGALPADEGEQEIAVALGTLRLAPVCFPLDVVIVRVEG